MDSANFNALQLVYNSQRWPQGNVKKEPQILGGTQRWSSEDETVVEGTPKAQGIKAN